MKSYKQCIPQVKKDITRKKNLRRILLEGFGKTWHKITNLFKLDKKISMAKISEFWGHSLKTIKAIHLVIIVGDENFHVLHLLSTTQMLWATITVGQITSHMQMHG